MIPVKCFAADQCLCRAQAGMSTVAMTREMLRELGEAEAESGQTVAQEQQFLFDLDFLIEVTGSLVLDACGE